MCGDTQQSLADVYGVGLTRGRRLPLIQVTNVMKTTFTIIIVTTRCPQPQAPGARRPTSASSPRARRRRKVIEELQFSQRV